MNRVLGLWGCCRVVVGTSTSSRARRSRSCSRSRSRFRRVARLGRSGQSSSSRDRSGAIGSGAARGSASAGKSAGKNDASDRPGASGHRFGPDLACSECGILWDVHQRDPKPCQTEAMRDAFARRPSADFDTAAPSVAPAPSSAPGKATEED